MIDQHYLDPRLAALYDEFCVGRPDFAFYLPMVMRAASVLDVGCGTGELLRLARGAGHRGTLHGIDPANAMLDQARACTSVDWTLGTVQTFESRDQFELVVMTGHAFQVLLTDDEISSVLTSVRSLLTDDGQFLFESLNPEAREWEEWAIEQPTMVPNPTGEPVTMTKTVDRVAGEFVTFTMTFTSPVWTEPPGQHEHASLHAEECS